MFQLMDPNLKEDILKYFRISPRENTGEATPQHCTDTERWEDLGVQEGWEILNNQIKLTRT